MPIYEFYCPDNNKIYSFFTQRLNRQDRVPRCPDDPGYRMVKLVSRVSIAARKSDRDDAGAGDDIDDARIEAAMGQMEREIAGMDENNPDPRKMGRFMREMAQLTGERPDAATQAMIERLEAGEDPEKLEEEMGDALDDGEGEDGGAIETETTGAVGGRRKHQGRAVRDEVLYDLEEYLA